MSIIFKNKIKKSNILKEDIIKKIQYFKLINIPFNLKPHYNSIIPLKTFTCWHTKDLPPLMKQNYDTLINMHPMFEHKLFDENECREFIKTNFGFKYMEFN